MEGYYQFRHEFHSIPDTHYVFNGDSKEVSVSTVSDIHNQRTMEDETVSDDKLLQWLRQTPGLSQTDSHSRVTFQIAWIRLKFELQREIDIQESTQNLILKSFAFDQCFYHYVRSSVSTGGFFRFPDDGDLEIFAIRLSSYCLVAWTYSRNTEQTSIICWGTDKTLGALRSSFRHQIRYTQGPMLPAICTAMALMLWTDETSHQVFKSVASVENRTQFFRGKPLHGIAEGSFTSLSAKMGESAALMAASERDCSLGIQILDSIYEYIQEQKDHLASKHRPSTNFDRCFWTLKQRFETQKHQVRYHARRADLQIQVLFNIVSQQDTQVSISIGEDSRRLASASKEDSLAMKTLAAVTMIFLPGTFVATLFSMPLFDWDKAAPNTTGMVSDRFWIYWVVTIPLTSLTIILWAVWIRMQIRRKVKRAEDDKVAYQRDILGAD